MVKSIKKSTKGASTTQGVIHTESMVLRGLWGSWASAALAQRVPHGRTSPAQRPEHGTRALPGPRRRLPPTCLSRVLLSGKKKLHQTVAIKKEGLTRNLGRRRKIYTSSSIPVAAEAAESCWCQLRSPMERVGEVPLSPPLPAPARSAHPTPSTHRPALHAPPRVHRGRADVQWRPQVQPCSSQPRPFPARNTALLLQPRAHTALRDGWSRPGRGGVSPPSHPRRAASTAPLTSPRTSPAAAGKSPPQLPRPPAAAAAAPQRPSPAGSGWPGAGPGPRDRSRGRWRRLREGSEA